MCIKLLYVLCQHFRHNLRPTFRQNFQKVLQKMLQADPEIKYHALSTSLLNITGYTFTLLADIYHILHAHAAYHLIQVSKNRP